MDCFPIKIYVVKNPETYFRITLKISCCYFSINCGWIKRFKEWKKRFLFRRETNKSSDFKYECLKFENYDSELNQYIKVATDKINNQLNSILNKPSIYNLTSNEKILLWQFKDNLKNKKNTIAKFLKSVDWNDKNCSLETLRLFSQWKFINLDECVELLNYYFPRYEVRHRLIKRLSLFSDNELLFYLPQLIQALKYDETENGIGLGLMKFLIKKSCKNKVLANNFYWYLIVETKNVQNKHNIFKFALEKFLTELKSNKVYRNLILDELMQQEKLINCIEIIFQALISNRGNRTKQSETFKYLLNYHNLNIFNEITHPLDPEIRINGIYEYIEIYKSASMPIKLVFKTMCNQNGKYMIIFKKDNHLRQDQLILHLIHYVHNVLQKNKLDLKLTPYKILATGINHGFVEYIDAITIADVLTNYNNIQNYLRYYNSSVSGPYGIQLNVIENFIKSCAGYCVITYLFGIGDRHFDNLLLTKDGKLFHIDFSYILGNDPKPMAPTIKFTKEMIDAMGGINSIFYLQFRKYCYLCLLCLRCHSNNILNIFEQLSEAYLTNIPFDERKSSVYILAENFKLFLTNDEVIEEFEKLLNASVKAVFPTLIESVHKLAQYLRR